MFLIAQSKLKHPFFIKYQQVIGTNGKYTKGSEDYSYICRCPSLISRCTSGLANQLDGSFPPDTELYTNRFWPSPFGEFVWHVSTQMNNGILAAWITVFDLRRDKRRCFIFYLVYALLYRSISSNLMTLANLSTRSDSVCRHTCSTFLNKHS